MITKDKLIEYHLANEKARYEAIKAITTSFKQALIALIVCITLIVCAYIYFVVPVEEETIYADHGTQIVSESLIGGDNTNGR